MALEEVQHVVSHKGFAPEENEGVSPKLLAFSDNPIDDLHGQVVLAVIFGRVAARAAKVAAHGGADEEDEWSARALSLLPFAAPRTTLPKTVHDQVGDGPRKTTRGSATDAAAQELHGDRGRIQVSCIFEVLTPDASIMPLAAAGAEGLSESGQPDEVLLGVGSE